MRGPFPTAFLADCIRGQRLLPVEEAVRLLTDVPARYFGLTERGRIQEGWIADVVVLDPATVGADEIELVHDLPGDSPRLFAGASGVAKVYVNGRLALDEGKPTGERAGAVLRSGRDTSTVPLTATDTR